MNLILIVYWFFNLPLCYYLAFTAGMGLQGLWVGLSISLTIIGISMNRTVNKTDWYSCYLDAKLRLERRQMSE